MAELLQLYSVFNQETPDDIEQVLLFLTHTADICKDQTSWLFQLRHTCSVLTLVWLWSLMSSSCSVVCWTEKWIWTIKIWLINISEVQYMQSNINVTSCAEWALMYSTDSVIMDFILPLFTITVWNPQQFLTFEKLLPPLITNIKALTFNKKKTHFSSNSLPLKDESGDNKSTQNAAMNWSHKCVCVSAAWYIWFLCAVPPHTLLYRPCKQHILLGYWHVGCADIILVSGTVFGHSTFRK